MNALKMLVWDPTHAILVGGREIRVMPADCPDGSATLLYTESDVEDKADPEWRLSAAGRVYFRPARRLKSQRRALGALLVELPWTSNEEPWSAYV